MRALQKGQGKKENEYLSREREREGWGGNSLSSVAL